MNMTRSQTPHRRTKRAIYRSRVKTSHCRGHPTLSTCVKTAGCKYTLHGIRRSYCRKKHNRRA